MRAGLTLGPVLAAALTCVPGSIGAQAPDRVTGRAWTHVVERGQSLRSIGSRYGIDLQPIRAANALRANAVLKVGQELRLDNRHIVPAGLADGTIVVNVPQRMLFYRAGDRLLAFPVAVGSRGWQTPVAPFTIVEKEEDPTWDVPASIAAEARRAGKPLPARVPPGPRNPLGRFWLRLSVGGVGLHGTNAPGSVYQAVTHGCIRLHPDDIAELFPLVSVGTAGRTAYEPILLVQQGGAVLLEVHRDIYGRGQGSAVSAVRAMAEDAGLTGQIDWRVAGEVIARREGVARVVTR